MTDVLPPELRFRPRAGSLGPIPDALDPVYDLIDSLWLPVHFYVHPDLKLAWEFTPRQEVPWESYRGRLLEAWQCRETRVMSAWNIAHLVNGQRSGEPLLSLKLDPLLRTIHVLRGIEVYAWETHTADGVVEEREVRRWQRELVGTCRLEDFADLEELRDELVCLLWQAVIGTSRLPLTSVEAPHPFFTFGMLHYLFQEEHGAVHADPAKLRPWRDWVSFVEQGVLRDMSEGERAKLLEFSLRCSQDPRARTPCPSLSASEGPSLALRLGRIADGHIDAEHADLIRLWREHWADAPGREPLRLMRRMFNDVSLSPYTGFVRQALDFCRALATAGVIAGQGKIDFLAFLVRQAYGHLLAYDLVLFHHRGANYPDALLVAEVLPRLLHALSGSASRPAWNIAVVLGCLMVHRYVGHAAPDEPTSPGENIRVLPAATQRVPPEQIEQPHLRTRRLFADWDWQTRLGERGVDALRSTIASFDDRDFQRLGTAVFIDRPFGEGKDLLEPDQTPLIAHEAFSLSLANSQVERLRKLAQEVGLGLQEEQLTRLRPRDVAEIEIRGISIQQTAPSERPIPALADARRVAPDFVVTRTLPGSLRFIKEVFGAQLGELKDIILVARTANTEHPSSLSLVDVHYQMRRHFHVNASRGFRSRAGVEFPVAGLVERASPGTLS